MNVPFFGKSAERAAAEAPQVMMAAPNGGGTFMAGARRYSVAQGRPFKAHSEDVEALQAQGCCLVQPGAQPRVLSREEVQAQQDASERATWCKVPAGEPQVRMLPGRSLSTEGRPYLTRNGDPQDVPACDARLLAANGWLPLASIGTAADRPPRALPLDRRIEDGRELIFDGRAWRDTSTGAAS